MEVYLNFNRKTSEQSKVLSSAKITKLVITRGIREEKYTNGARRKMTESETRRSRSRWHEKITVENVKFKIPSLVQRKTRRRTQNNVLRTCHNLNFEDENSNHSTFAKEQSSEIR